MLPLPRKLRLENGCGSLRTKKVLSHDTLRLGGKDGDVSLFRFLAEWWWFWLILAVVIIPIAVIEEKEKRPRRVNNKKLNENISQKKEVVK